MIVGTAGVPLQLGETRNYDLIFSQLEAAGVKVYYPCTQYQEIPTAQSLGFETDFLPPPFGTADASVYEAMRAHGIKLAINAEQLYDLSQRFPSADLDPLRALIKTAGRDILYGVYGPDEPASREIDPAVSRRLYEHVKAIDPSLPVIQIEASINEENPVMQTQQGRAAYLAAVLDHAKWADIVGFDVYTVGASVGAVTPYSKGELVPPGQAVRDYMTWLTEHIPDKLYTMVLQGFSPTDLYSAEALAKMDPDLVAACRGPTAQEMHDMLAATEGAEAVFWWGQSHLKNTSSATWQNLLTETDAWVDAHGDSNLTVVAGTAGNDRLHGNIGVDRLAGNAGEDLLVGRHGDDILVGGGGGDTMRGGANDDTYYVDSRKDIVDEASGGGVDEIRTALATYTLNSSHILGSIEKLTGIGLTGQALTGNAAANVITGGYGDDVLTGQGGHDRLTGGLGSDVLTGGAGSDNFVFNTALKAATNTDTITDFSVPGDTIELENAIFTALHAGGTLASSAFHIGVAAADSNDRIVYNPATGALSYDADGLGGAAATRFATVDTGLDLTHADFLVV